MDAETIGAIVLGGDYQGLGIVRSLGRKGIPICVIDDEPSVARHSRYASFAVRVPRLRHEEEVLGSVLDVGERLGLEGWVLYPTRDEIVAAFSRRREELERFFRVPTPPWESISRAWDKRLSYEHARTLGVPSPRTWRVGDAAELDAVDERLPLVIKPAIKEHFIYATNTKAWRAGTRDGFETLFRHAAGIVPTDEVMGGCNGRGSVALAPVPAFRMRRPPARIPRPPGPLASVPRAVPRALQSPRTRLQSSIAGTAAARRRTDRGTPRPLDKPTAASAGSPSPGRAGAS